MTVHLVTRHAGAVAWLASRGVEWDSTHAHLSVLDVEPGDTVLGILPLPKAAAICARGARYLHICLDVPADRRGEELSLDEMLQLKPFLKEFRAIEVSGEASS